MNKKTSCYLMGCSGILGPKNSLIRKWSSIVNLIFSWRKRRGRGFFFCLLYIYIYRRVVLGLVRFTSIIVWLIWVTKNRVRTFSCQTVSVLCLKHLILICKSLCYVSLYCDAPCLIYQHSYHFVANMLVLRVYKMNQYFNLYKKMMQQQF